MRLMNDTSADAPVAGQSGSSARGTALSFVPRWLSARCAALVGKRPVRQAEVSHPLPAADDLCPDEATEEPQSLVDEMLLRGRYALLLRQQLIGNLTSDEAALARASLAAGMCLVPGGPVALASPDELSGDDCLGRRGTVLRVEAFYLDRAPVTNYEFRQFIVRGGYEQMAIWDPDVWPAVLDFVDATGHPGPRYWRRGRYPRAEERHPVVGVSWYEATAYARWVGKRLPSDAEWVKAGSWPVATGGDSLLSRRFPWGDAMDRGRANLWGSGPGRTVDVHEFAEGASVGGVEQLIGNVWEWTADTFLLDGTQGSAWPGEARMKSIRGGAYDTYLDSQSTCHFQSGDRALARKHNIGFRCAIGLCDLAEMAPAANESQPLPAGKE